ncbi:MAG TPA: ATP-binding protein, partial [Acidimicrobiia bacterium]|nr:ATP-binding protein [Acidimicrobiia bacterium]
VFGNLIRNAREAMPQGGRLTVRARPVGEDRLEVEVSDTGVGISPENLARIMEPLYSTKARGLGLAIARRIARAHDGDLVLEPPADGAGAAFLLTLPLAA